MNTPRSFFSWGLRAALAVVLGFGLWHLTTSPKMWFDDGIASNVSKNLALFGTYGIQTAPGVLAKDLYWVTIQHPVTLPVALVFRLFGVTVLGMRLVMIGYLLATVLAGYALARELTNERVAIWSAWLLATFSPFYGNGKAMLGETPGVFWLLLGTWLWQRSAKAERSLSYTFGAGIAFGLCAISKPAYLLLLPSIYFVRLVKVIQQRRLDLKQELAFGVPIAVLLLGWLAQITPKPLSLEHLWIVVRFFSNSYGEVITHAQIFHNALRFVTESTPLHFSLLVTIIAIACVQKRRGFRDAPPALMALGLFCVLSLLWYLKTPGWYRYFYSIHLVALTLVPVALWQLQASWLTEQRKRAFLIALVIAQTIVTWQNADRFRSVTLFDLQATLQERGLIDKPLFLAHVPEAALVLPSNHLSQTIYINPTLTIGENPLLKKGVDLPPLVITASPGDVGVGAIESTLQQNYRVIWSESHYRILEKVVSPSS